MFDLTSPSPDQLRALAAGLTDDERHLLLDHGEEAPFRGLDGLNSKGDWHAQ